MKNQPVANSKMIVLNGGCLLCCVYKCMNDESKKEKQMQEMYLSLTFSA